MKGRAQHRPVINVDNFIWLLGFFFVFLNSSFAQRELPQLRVSTLIPLSVDSLQVGALQVITSKFGVVLLPYMAKKNPPPFTARDIYIAPNSLQYYNTENLL